MRTSALLVIASVIIASCGQQVQVQNNVQVIKTISEEQLYEFDVVSGFSSQVNDSLKQEAKQEFLNAIDQFRNKKDAQASVLLFKKSLLIYPEVKAYYEMGNALMEAGNYGEAIQAYHMAEKMDYNPISKVLYNLACAYSLSENGDEALKYIQLAIENGYANTKHLLTDEDLTFARALPGFNDAYEGAMSGATSPERALFDLYAINFEAGTLPFEVEAMASQHVDLGKYIAYDFEEFVPEMVNPQFSRNVGDEFYYLAKVNENTNYTAVIYAGVQVMYENPPVYHMLVTYSPEGKIISALEIGGFHYYDDPMKGYKITPDFKVEVSEYEVAFEKDVEEFGYEDNTMASSELLNKKDYQITETGKIKPLGATTAWIRGFYE
jgi:tetratricopeptide (TPR) repeat protein